MSCSKVLFIVLFSFLYLICTLSFLFMGLTQSVSTLSISDAVNLVESLVTIFAILIGGIWAYWLFVLNRQRYPRATLTHDITHKVISPDKVLLHIDMVISNIGEVLLEIVSVETMISQVLPLPDDIEELIMAGEEPISKGKSEVDWSIISSRKLDVDKSDYEVEPGESQGIQFDFILDSEISTVEIYSYVKNERKRQRELAWDLTTFYDIAN